MSKSRAAHRAERLYLEKQDRPETESEIKRAIKRRILGLYPQAMVWHNHGNMYTKSNNGIPDLMCVVNGKFYAMEIKKPETRGSTTEEQRNWIARLNSEFAGGEGCAAVVTSPDEAELLLGGAPSEMLLFEPTIER